VAYLEEDVFEVGLEALVGGRILERRAHVLQAQLQHLYNFAENGYTCVQGR
jgi:hypothetical protein